MKLYVTAYGAPWRGRLVCNGRSFPCALGRDGVHPIKREGDGRTPAGEYTLRRMLYRPDRIAPPNTRLPVKPIRLFDGWCDAAGHPAYNQQVRLPISASAERLRRADRVYDLIAVIGYNDDPPAPGLGSAIFLHVARANFAPTAGCIALKRKDLLALLAHCDARTRIIIGNRHREPALTGFDQ